MHRSELFDLWAPERSTWARWAKPVLFANMSEQVAAGSAAGSAGPDASWAPAPEERTALILDLPGAESVVMGLALAHRGYRPVPLFNTTSGPKAIIEMDAIVRALQEGGPALAGLRIADDLPPSEVVFGPAHADPAPPAFLLDSSRLGALRPSPGAYDNRWVVFPQDFPSGTFLLSCGIKRVLLVRAGGRRMEDDLRHVLVRWRRAGLEIMHTLRQPGAALEPLAVSAPFAWRFLPALGLVMLGLRRNSAGGFGARVPQQASGRSGFS